MTQAKRRFISVDDIYQMYLPLSKKRIRWLLKRYLPDKTKIIGGRIYTDRDAFERLLADPGRMYLPLE